MVDDFDFEINMEVREIHIEVRKELVRYSSELKTIKLEGELLKKLNAFLDKNNHAEDMGISEMIGKSFWEEFYAQNTDVGNNYVQIDKKREAVIVFSDTIDELNSRAKDILLIMDTHIDKLVDRAIELRLKNRV